MLGMCMCVLLLQAGQTGAMEPMCVGCGVGSEDQVQEARTSGGQGGEHGGHQAGRARGQYWHLHLVVFIESLR